MRSPPSIKTRAWLPLTAGLPNAGDAVGAGPEAPMQRQLPLESTAPSPDDQMSPGNCEIHQQLRSAVRIPRIRYEDVAWGARLGEGLRSSWLAGVAEDGTLGFV
jgi:hypothetical protein